MEWTGFLLLFAVGIICGVINILAGGGSFLTLPVLIFLGMPAITANGTNRLGILLQNIGAVWSFQRHGLISWEIIKQTAIPSCLGSIVGVWIAFAVGNELFQKILAFLMVAITLWTLWDSTRKVKVNSGANPFFLFLAFFLIGIYGGFVQAGIGFFVLAATTWAGFDLVKGNAIKVTVILIFIFLTLGLFAWRGEVQWIPGIVLGLGNLIGGLIGVKLTILKGHSWIRGVVTVTIIIFAIKLWIS
jgi:uncharacterized membrane protein YfcA